MEKPKYKAGDVVHVRLDEDDARCLNHNTWILDIIAHIPRPEPVVRWVNMYEHVNYNHSSKEDAEEEASDARIALLRKTWPDGDTSKPPVVSVEGV